jgi:hypothetical protein
VVAQWQFVPKLQQTVLLLASLMSNVKAQILVAQWLCLIAPLQQR